MKDERMKIQLLNTL